MNGDEGYFLVIHVTSCLIEIRFDLITELCTVYQIILKFPLLMPAVKHVFLYIAVTVLNVHVL
jgi:hypothetical protein